MVRLLSLWALIALLVLPALPSTVSLASGLPIVALGEALRLWTAGQLRKTGELAVSGPYGYTRNPLYLGRLLIFTGLCLACLLPYYANYAILLLGYVVFFGYYLPRKERVEPARLRRVHGETYERYFRAVPALLPAARPYEPGGGQRWSLERVRRNREHWMVIGLVAATVYLFWRASLL